jgi:deoxycytidylate deaminase
MPSARASSPPDGPELVFALVGAAGTRLTLVAEVLRDILEAHAYGADIISLSELLDQLPTTKPRHPRRDVDIANHMDAGNKLRRTLKSGDEVALLAVAAIRNRRRRQSGSQGRPANRHAYILRSMKHPAEIATLRQLYGARLSLIAAYSPRETRVDQLAADIAASYNRPQAARFRDKAEALISRDEAEEDDDFGQKVRDTFPQADVFVETTDEQTLRGSLQRYVELVFAHPFHTPTRDEFGMFHAQAAALRSADLSRQVGAAIATEEGDVIAIGTNEVPKPGGGLYWEGDVPDHRDFQRGEDPNQILKSIALAEVLDELRKKRWLSRQRENAALASFEKLLKDTRVANLIEFNRAVHAEMAALTDGVRRGIAVKDCTIYVTTFPCHGCAKHIVAAGLARCLYVEPYPKSLAQVLHDDSLAVDASTNPAPRVDFKPFVGVAPRQYIRLFSRGRRKDGRGKASRYRPAKAVPAGVEELSDPTYITRERGVMTVFSAALNQRVLTPRPRRRRR